MEQYEIVATLDSHTSEICQDLDGKVYDMKIFDPGSTAPPFHPRCRSTTVPYIDDDDGTSRTLAGFKLKQRVIAIRVDSLYNNENFRELLGYINTAKGSQLKGVSGYAK